MKRQRKVKLRFLPVAFGGGVVLYFIVAAFVYILAQTVSSAILHAVFRFCLCLPLLSILCLVISQFFLRVDTEESSFCVERLKEGKYILNVTNGSILPVSCVRVCLAVPLCNGEGETVLVTKSAAVPPISTVSFEFSARYDRRGVMKVGSDSIYVYDLLHIVRIKKKISGICTVAVLPRVLEERISEYDDKNGDEDPIYCKDSLLSYDYGDIREYRPGDAMKRIHWKLSSKGEELQVKKYSDLSQKTVCVICDRSGDGSLYGISKKDRLEADDVSVEEAFAFVSEISERDGNGSLIVSADGGGVLRRDFSGNGSEKDVRVWLSELGGGSNRFLHELIPDELSNLIYVFAFLSSEQAMRVFDCQRAISGALTAHICDVSALVPSSRREEYAEDLKRLTASLSKGGISFYVSKIAEVRNET